jgi:hypothetical protein
MSTIALYVDSNVPSSNVVKNCTLANVTILGQLDDVLKLEGIERIGLMYSNDGLKTVPFKINKKKSIIHKQKLSKDTAKYTRYTWYSQAFVDFLKSIKEKGVNELDLITCSLTDTVFISETAAISELTGVKIGYSLDQTGNSVTADWVLESNGQNLLGVYFTEDIKDNWNYVLDSITLGTSTDIIDFFNSTSVSPSGALTYIDGTYHLSVNVTIAPQPYVYQSNPYEYVHIRLNQAEVFNGHGNTITLTYGSSGFFVINSSSLTTTIKKLTMNNTQITNRENSGGIVRNGNGFFTVSRCVNNSGFDGYQTGGICGAYCHHFLIEKCTNNGDLTGTDGGCGGICGAYCNNFEINKCTNNSIISSLNSNEYGSGGIAGKNCYNTIISHCENTATNYSYGGGGIVGAEFGSSDDDDSDIAVGLCAVRHCKNYGDIYGYEAGGICGSDLGYVSTEYSQNTNHSMIEIYKCVNKGTIYNTGSGICGGQCGGFDSYPNYDSDYLYMNYVFRSGCVIHINKCYTTSGNICGEDCLMIDSDYVLNFTHIGTDLIIEDTYTREKVPMVTSFDISASSEKVVYIGEKHHKMVEINLIANPFFMATKRHM